MPKILVFLLTFAISVSATATPLENPYKSLSCKYNAVTMTADYGDVALNGILLDLGEVETGRLKEFFIIETEVQDLGLIRIRQAWNDPHQLHIDVLHSDNAVGLSISGAMEMMTARTGTRLGLFTFIKSKFGRYRFDCRLK